jgi:glutathione peroxidase
MYFILQKNHFISSSITHYLCNSYYLQMKYLISLFMLFGLFKTNYIHAQEVPKSIYDFKVKAIDGNEIDFSSFKGKKILIGNTASKCGLTPQYDGLEALYEKYKDKLVIIGFPANNFLGQEPGENETIAAFCKKNYGVTFLMAEKIDVKGKNMHPLYIWLTEKKHNGVSDNTVKWNFQKYLIDEAGNFVEVFSPKVEPNSSEIIAAIEK